jgi:HEAT repeat protein
MPSRARVVVHAVSLIVCLAAAARAASPASSPTTAPSTAPAAAPVALPSLIVTLEAPASAVERAGGFDRTTVRRLVALEKIEGLGPAAAEAAPSLARALAVPQLGPAAASALRSLGEAARPVLSEAADYADPWVRGTAIQLLCSLGPEALPFAERGMNDPDPRVRTHVVYGLPSLGETGEPLLAAAMEASEPQVRRAAFGQVLGRVRAGEAPLSHTLRENSLQAALADSDPLIRYSALIRKPPPVAATFAAPTADLGADWPVRWQEAQRAKGFFRRPPEDLRPFLREFTRALDDPDPRARVAALRALDDLNGELRNEALATLSKVAVLASSDPNAEVRAEAHDLWRALVHDPRHRLGAGAGPLVVSALWSVLTQPAVHPSFRRTSAQLLKKYWNGVASPPRESPQSSTVLTRALLHGFQDGEVGVHEAAPLLIGIAEHEAFRAEAVAAYGAVFRGSPPDVRVNLLARAAGHVAAPTLQLALADADPLVRGRAARMAAETRWDATPLAPAMIALMADPDPNLRIAAARVAKDGYLDITPLVPALTALLADADPKVRKAAVEGLGSPWDRKSRSAGKSYKLVNANQPVVAALVPVLADPDPGVAQVAATTLNVVSSPPGAKWVGGSRVPVPLPPPPPGPFGGVAVSSVATPAPARQAPRTVSLAAVVSIALLLTVLVLALLLRRRFALALPLSARSASVVGGGEATSSGTENESLNGMHAALARVRERRGR